MTKPRSGKSPEVDVEVGPIQVGEPSVKDPDVEDEDGPIEVGDPNATRPTPSGGGGSAGGSSVGGGSAGGGTPYVVLAPPDDGECALQKVVIVLPSQVGDDADAEAVEDITYINVESKFIDEDCEDVSDWEDVVISYGRYSGDLQARLSRTPAAETPWLTGAEIKALMPTGRLEGVNAYGNPYTITYAANGAMSGVAGKSNEFTDTGKWWVEGDLFCRRYTIWLDGKTACFRARLEGDTIKWFDTSGAFVSSDTFVR